MELIDIWHFVLSKLINENPNEIDSITHFVKKVSDYKTTVIKFNGNIYAFDKMSLLEKLKLLMTMFGDDMLNIQLFFSICHDAGLTQESIYKQYVGKNILNIFRQQNGYKDGSYIKIWGGEEDNVYLARLMDTMCIDDESFADNLMDELVIVYTHLT